ncbi:TRAP transporter substrate-binding protein DctP [Aidingimonas lacisalsi]|uniref:TRAP transporter substrate-binding protein DctP n=1 Tax=Aidingimonas lacisalsi TaxID=2604086 RepID=UPI00191C06D3|nr:TRAP transporter substrate-binding protein DctP [Aidingimonas lacisalsi]
MKRQAAIVTLLTSAGMIAACSSDGEDNYTLQYTTYSNSTSDQSKTVQRWAQEVEELTDGGVKVEFHYSQSLVGANEALEATVDGRADLAQVGSLYAASDLPMFTVVELPFETQNPEAQMRAIKRLYENKGAFRENFDSEGVKLLYPLPLGSLVMGLNEPAKSPDELDGRSIRSNGLTSEALLTVGANPTAMTANDIYESMERGIIDGYSALSVANLSTFGVSSITPYLINPGIGVYASSIVVVNKELFESMPPGYQEAIEEASVKAISIGLEELDSAAQVACSELKENDTQLSSFPQAEASDWQKRTDLASWWVNENEDKGYNAESVLRNYRSFIKEEEESSSYEDPFNQCMNS